MKRQCGLHPCITEGQIVESTMTAAATAIGFKEWAFICDALVQGVQTIILRKGGIHEGRGGFEFKHRDFFLFPTWFHTQAERLRWAPAGAQRAFPPEEERQTVDISGCAVLEQLWKVTDWSQVQALEPLHVWKEEIVRERFVQDDESCLHVALVRTYKLPKVWTFPYSKSYGGCRSWVNLPDEGLALAEQRQPVINDEVWNAEAAKIREILS